MPKYTNVNEIFEQAIEAFPYPHLQSTGCTDGDLEHEADCDEIEYSEEFTFEAGQLLEETLTGGGWIDVRKEGSDVSISAFFGLTRNNNWKNGRVLPEHTAMQTMILTARHGNFGLIATKLVRT